MQYFELTATAAGTLPGATLYVYDGNVANGTAIYTQAYPSITVAGAGSPITINITGSLPLISGNQYSFRFEASTLNFHYTTGDTYTGGHTWQNGSQLTETDFYFVIQIGTSCSPSLLTPDVATLPDLTDECSVMMPTAPTATDNCGGTITGTSTTTVPITAQGNLTITWTFDDENGNTSTQTQSVNNLTVDNTVTVNGTMLQANQLVAGCQWLDCDAANAPINGEINQSYTPLIFIYSDGTMERVMEVKH